MTKAVDASEESVKISLAQYRTGATDFNRVFTLADTLVSDQDEFAIAKGQLANSLIAAYKAIGGGWEIRYGIRRGTMIDMNAMLETADTLPATPEGKPADETGRAAAGADRIEMRTVRVADSCSPNLRNCAVFDTLLGRVGRGSGRGGAAWKSPLLA